jgi:hypothetical protein
LAWASFQPRTRILADELDGEARFVAAGGPAPLRYLFCAVKTWLALSGGRPDRVLVITPPVFAPLTAWLWCALHGRDLVVDCHTGAFHSARWAWARPLHRLLLRRARAVTLHTEPAAELVAAWGATALLLPDDVPSDQDVDPGATASGARVVVAGSLDENEPVAEALEAAALMPDVTFAFTGDPARMPAKVLSRVPGNVTLTGYLPYGAFLAELRSAELVAVLSTDPEIMNRAAFEAVGLGSPLLLSDLPGLRARFGAAARFTANDPAAMADSIAGALAEAGPLAERSVALGDVLRAQHGEGISRLRAALGEPSPTAGEG